MANVVSRPKFPGRGRADDEHPVAIEVDPFEQLAEQLVGFGQRRRQSCGPLGTGRRQAVAVGPLQVRHLDQHGVAAAVPCLVEGGEHGLGVHAPAAGGGEVDHAELASDRAVGHPARLVHHGQRGLAVALVGSERWASVGVGDDRRGQTGVADGLAHRPWRGAVQQAVRVGHRVADGQREHRCVARILARRGAVQLGPGVGTYHLVGIHRVAGTVALHPGPVAGAEGDVALAEVGAGTDGPHRQRGHGRALEERHQVGRGEVGHVLPDEPRHRHDERPAGRPLGIVALRRGRGGRAHDQPSERDQRGRHRTDHGAGPEGPAHRPARSSR